MRRVLAAAWLATGAALAQAPDEASACLERLRQGSTDPIERTSLRGASREVATDRHPVE